MDSPRIGSHLAARVSWVDTAKGFGIILVVLGHVLRGLVTSDLIAWTPAARYIDAWIYAFHMPLFFVVSGLFLSRSTTAKPLYEFGWDKVRTIAYPYFVWSIITLLIKAPLGGAVNHPRQLSELPSIFYQPIEQFWFLYVLFFLTIAAGLLLKLGAGPWAVLLVACLLHPGVLPSSGWEPLELARIDAIYLAIGVIVGNDRLSSMTRGVGPALLAGLAVIGFSIVFSLAKFLEIPHTNALNLVLALCGIAGSIAGAILLSRANLDAPIRFLGRHSLEIFVAHTIVSAATRIILQKIAHISMPAPYFFFGILFGLYVPALAAVALERMGVGWVFYVPDHSEHEDTCYSGRPAPHGATEEQLAHPLH